MTHETRLIAGCALTLSVGFAAICCSAGVPDRAERTRLAIQAAQLACVEYLSGRVPARVLEADELCPLLAGPPQQTWPQPSGQPRPKERDMAAHGPAAGAGNLPNDGPVSGDSGPDGGPGQGVRAVQ